MLSSPPTISQEDHDDDDEDGDEDDSEQSDSGSSSSSGSSTKSDDSSDKDQDSDEKEDDDDEEEVVFVEELAIVKATIGVEVEMEVADDDVAWPSYPTQVMYENRDILNLGGNVWSSNEFVSYTVLPENNVNCFFQNRAQYWRLANKDDEYDKLDRCDCCGFGFPSQVNNNDNTRGQFAEAGGPKNPITDSLKLFLKNNQNYIDQQSPVVPPIANVQQQPMMSAMHHGVGVGGNATSAGPQGYNNNNMINKRMYNNNSAPYAAYQAIQQQAQQVPPQQYQNNQNGYFGGNGNGGFNPYNNSSNNNNNNSNNAGAYNGTAIALLNLMKASRNVSGAAFQATMNNSSRYYNNNIMNTTSSNNGFGLYKQF